MKALLTAILALFGLSFETLACSVTRDYVRPTNYELIKLTDAIVVVTVTGEVKYMKDGEEGGKTSFTVDKVLKGKGIPDSLNLHLILGDMRPSDPNDLLGVHPQAMAGGCNRYMVSLDKQYVVFLKQHESEGLQAYLWYPFTRAVEDYHGDQSIWMKAITYYLSVQNDHTPMDQLDVLKAKYNNIIDNPQSEYHDRLLALDIAGHLMSRSPYKPTEYLIQTYQALDKGEKVPFGVRSPKADIEDSDAQRFADLLFRPREERPFDVSAQKEFILWSLANGEHPKAKNFMLELLNEDHVSGAVIGSVAKYLARHDDYIMAAETIRQHGLMVVATESPKDVNEFLRGAIRIHDNDKHYMNPEWKSVPTVRAWWPKFSFAMTQIYNARFGRGSRDFSRAILEDLRPSDYRKEPEFSIALVRGYDDHVVEWAKTEISRLLSEKIETYKRDYALPIGILLEDYRSDDSRPVEKLFCGSRDTRLLLLKYIGSHQDIYTEELIARMALHPEYDKEEREYLLKSLTMFAGNNRAEYIGHRGGWESNNEFDLLIKLIKGEKIDRDKDIKPIVCETVLP